MSKPSEEKFLVTQSNQLIEANYSSNLTTLAHKVARLIVGFINPQQGESALSVTIEINKLKAYLGWSKGTKWNRFHNDLKDISKRLNKEPIEIPLEDKKVLVAYFLSSYTLDIKGGKVTFDIAPKLVPHLTKLKANFTTYQLKYIPTLTSSYAIRMYELFYQYRRIGNRKFTVEDFRKKLGAPAKYKYNDLKKRIITPAQGQLKENTNLAFVYNEIKTGRSITSLEFIIFNNTPTNKDNQMELNFLNDYIEEAEEQKPAFSEKIIEALNKIGISEQNIAKYLSQGFEIITDEENRVGALERCKTIGNYYIEKLELLKNSPSAQSKENSAGFLIKALKEDWKSSKSLEKIKSSKKAKERTEAEKNIKTTERKILKLTKKKDELNEPIYNSIITNKDDLKTAYENAMELMGSFFKGNHRELLTKPIEEQYRANKFLEVSINMQFQKMYPDKFTESRELEKMVDNHNHQIKVLQKQYNL